MYLMLHFDSWEILVVMIGPYLHQNYDFSCIVHSSSWRYTLNCVRVIIIIIINGGVMGCIIRKIQFNDIISVSDCLNISSIGSCVQLGLFRWVVKSTTTRKV